jgi:hypothetical protein
MEKSKHLAVLLLTVIGSLLLIAMPVAAGGGVTHYSGVIDVFGPPVDPPSPRPLPKEKLLFEDWVLSPSHHRANDPRATGWPTVTINGILGPSKRWWIWGTTDCDLDGYDHGDGWIGG